MAFVKRFRHVGFIAALAIFVMAAVLMVSNFRSLIREGQAFAQMAEKNKVLDKTLSLIIEAEMAEHVYLLTGNEAHLKAYKNAIGPSGLPPLIQALHQSPVDTLDEKKDRHLLELLVATRLSELREAIDTRRQRGVKAARLTVLNNLGQKTTAKTRAIIGDIKHDEEQFFALQTAVVDAHAQKFVGAFILLVSLAVGMLSVSGVLIQREITRREHTEQTVRRLNGELEMRVQERTAELQHAQQRLSEYAREVEEAQIEILERLALAGEFRDDDTGQHTQRVATTTALLAQQIGFPVDQVRWIKQAARLHDVGKIGISDTILLKPGKLTDEEFALMKTHTTIGKHLFENGRSELVKMGQRIAASHHERWDGTGYPQGLQGEAIPIEARLLAIADVFDALTHERPYKKAWPVPEAVAEIERHSGLQFDPKIVDIFLQLRHDTLT